MFRFLEQNVGVSMRMELQIMHAHCETEILKFKANLNVIKSLKRMLVKKSVLDIF